jgi:hypothetical protein
MGLREFGQRFLDSVRRPRNRPASLETVTLPDLIDWFLKHKDARGNGVIAFSYIYKPPARPPVRLKGLPNLDEAAHGLIVVQGFYDQATEEVLRFRTIQTQRIDDEVAESHAGKDMVVYK